MVTMTDFSTKSAEKDHKIDKEIKTKE